MEVGGRVVVAGRWTAERDTADPGERLGVSVTGKLGEITLPFSFPTVITSYSIHYTKLYEMPNGGRTIPVIFQQLKMEVDSASLGN